MSNRFAGQNRGEYRNSSQAHKKFVPKKDLRDPNSHQTLSNSLRGDATSVSGDGDAAVASSSRVRMGGNGEWVSKASPNGNFVVYLPQDEAVAAGRGPEEGGLDPVESQRVVDLLNRELSRLLKLRPKDFWKEVATDESLSTFLQSFLKFRGRWYDFPHRGTRGVVAGVIVGEFDLCRRVFMVLYRISSNQDPGATASNTLSQRDHEAVLQEKRLLDLPTLLDICAIYGHENEDLVRMLVMNAMKAQSYIRADFPVLISHFLTIAQTMYERCSSSLEVLLSSGGHQDQGSSQIHLDYLEVMDFINDSVVSLDSFVYAYKHAAVYLCSPAEMSYGNEDLLATLATLHDSLLPSLQRGFRIVFGTEDKNKDTSSDFLPNVLVSLKMLSMRITNLGWRLLYLCYLSDEAFEGCDPLPVTTKMFPANVEDPVVRADILIQTIRDLMRDQSHIPQGQPWGTFIQNTETNHKILGRITLLRETGWLSMDGEQWQFLLGIMVNPLQADTKWKSTTPPVMGNNTQTDEDAAIIESKISQIKELFPDYGRAFLVACLEAYNQDPEEVIQRILEGTLHKELESLDTSLDTVPSSKPPSIAKNDKGKGKLVEPIISSPEVILPTMKPNQPGVSLSSSSSTVGRFVRKNNDDLSDYQILNTRNDKELAKTAALISQFEYEDEYDDSFDDLGMSVGDSGLDEPERIGEKNDTQRGRGIDNDNGSSSSNVDNSKWNSRKTPQFYVKDGKNYSYKVDGSVAVANFNEAKLVNQAQKELIHGLGKGGNLPLGAVRALMESEEEQNDEQSNDEFAGRGRRGAFRGRGGRRGFSSSAPGRKPPESKDKPQDRQDGDEAGGTFRGRGRRGFPSAPGRKPSESEEPEDGQDGDEAGGRGGRGNNRGGGGRRGRGRNNNNYRKDRAMNKHFSGMPSHYGT